MTNYRQVAGNSATTNKCCSCLGEDGVVEFELEPTKWSVGRRSAPVCCSCVDSMIKMMNSRCHGRACDRCGRAHIAGKTIHYLGIRFCKLCLLDMAEETHSQFLNDCL